MVCPRGVRGNLRHGEVGGSHVITQFAVLCRCYPRRAERHDSMYQGTRDGRQEREVGRLGHLLGRSENIAGKQSRRVHRLCQHRQRPSESTLNRSVPYISADTRGKDQAVLAVYGRRGQRSRDAVIQ